MIKYILFIAILAMRLFYQPANTTSSVAPFSNLPMKPALTTVTTGSVKLINFSGMIKNNKVVLHWVVDDNETANFFEVEKSTDGIHFTMAALVFGTDKPVSETYEFYERAGKKKMIYRIKIINKDQKTEYSPVVELHPTA